MVDSVTLTEGVPKITYWLVPEAMAVTPEPNKVLEPCEGEAEHLTGQPYEVKCTQKYATCV